MKKSLQKILAVILTVCMLTAFVAVIPANATETDLALYDSIVEEKNLDSLYEKLGFTIYYMRGRLYDTKNDGNNYLLESVEALESAIDSADKVYCYNVTPSDDDMNSAIEAMRTALKNLRTPDVDSKELWDLIKESRDILGYRSIIGEQLCFRFEKAYNDAFRIYYYGQTQQEYDDAAQAIKDVMTEIFYVAKGKVQDLYVNAGRTEPAPGNTYYSNDVDAYWDAYHRIEYLYKCTRDADAEQPSALEMLSAVADMTVAIENLVPIKVVRPNTTQLSNTIARAEKVYGIITDTRGFTDGDAGYKEFMEAFKEAKYNMVYGKYQNDVDKAELELRVAVVYIVEHYNIDENVGVRERKFADYLKSLGCESVIPVGDRRDYTEEGFVAYDYNEEYCYYAENNNTITPDWVLVRGYYGWHDIPCTAFACEIFGIYEFETWNRSIEPASQLGMYIYVTAEDKFYSLKQAYESGKKDIVEAAFENYMVYEMKGNANIFGDNDHDGRLTIMDATLLQRQLAKISYIEKSRTFNTTIDDSFGGMDESYEQTDFNKDGRTDIMDATCIQRKLARMDW